jgi:hypothetical protein
MAEERNLATARAPESAADPDATKEELQRRMEEARESITQTVSDIKETVTTQYQSVRESISQTLDWREQYRRRPVALAVGAFGVGAVAGYAVGGLVFGELGRAPKAGDSVEIDGMRFVVADVDGPRILHVDVTFGERPASISEPNANG